jgi:hypothetical protein
MKGRLSEAHSISLGFLKNRGLTESTVSYAMRSILTEVCETRICHFSGIQKLSSFHTQKHREQLLHRDTWHTDPFTHRCFSHSSFHTPLLRCAKVFVLNWHKLVWAADPWLYNYAKNAGDRSAPREEPRPKRASKSSWSATFGWGGIQPENAKPRKDAPSATRLCTLEAFTPEACAQRSCYTQTAIT